MNVANLLVKENWKEISKDMRRENIQVLYLIFISLVIYFVFTLSIEYGPIAHNNFEERGLDFSISRALSFSIEYVLIFIGVPLFVYLRKTKKAIKELIITIAILVIVVGLTAFFTHIIQPSANEREWENDPRLLIGILYLLPIILVLRLSHRYPDELTKLGLSKKNLFSNILWGVLFGCLFIFHIIFSTRFKQAYNIVIEKAPYFINHLFYEIGTNDIGEELFFRCFIFGFFYYTIRWGYWRSAIISSALFSLSYIASREYTINPDIATGVVFYVFFEGMIYSAIYRFRKSIVSPIVCSVFVSMTYYFVEYF